MSSIDVASFCIFTWINIGYYYIKCRSSHMYIYTYIYIGFKKITPQTRKGELFCWKYFFWKCLSLYWLIASSYFFAAKVGTILTFIKWCRFQQFLNIYFTIFITSDILSCWSYSPFGLLMFIHILSFIAIFNWKYFLSLWNEGISDIQIQKVFA